MRDISPLAELGSRPPEAGRIRMGVKTAKAMRSIDTFRFTSPDRRIIEDIARIYGGQVEQWNEPRANPSQQWQVITTSNEIRVKLIANGISTWYELWAGSGVVRRCDGIDVQTSQQFAGVWEPVSQPCLCRVENRRQCEPHTRLQVVIPDVSFLGVWRLESGGWDALEELPGMYNLLLALTEQGRMVDAVLSIEQRERITKNGKRKFVVPRLASRQTVDELTAGPSTRDMIGGAPLAALAPAVDAEIIDGEIVDDEMVELEVLLAADAAYFGLPVDPYVAAVKARAKDDKESIRRCIQRVRDGELAATGFDKGRIVWRE